MSTLGTGPGYEMATWYYVGSFGQLGPLTFEQLEELVDGGVIERETYVWNPGMPNWLPASQVPQLVGSLGRRVPYMEPPPPPSAAPRSAPSMPTAPKTPPAFGTMASSSAMVHSATSVASAYGAYASPYGMVSDRSRTIGGILNIFLPGIGRIYLGYSALGVIQLLATVASCGILQIWSIIDGVLILTGSVKIDGYGRILKD